MVQCSESSGGRHAIKRSVAANENVKSSRHEILIEHLRPATLYTVVVWPINRMGSGPESEPAVFTTPEAGTQVISSIFYGIY